MGILRGLEAKYLRGTAGASRGRDPMAKFDVFEVARKVGAAKTFKKPFRFEDLIAAVRELTKASSVQH